MHTALVSMPWAIFNLPSVQLGALQASIREQLPEQTIQTFHPYLSAAQAIGLENYSAISANPWAGEALYSALLFPQHSSQAKKLFCKERIFDQNQKELASQFDTFSATLGEHFQRWLEEQDFSSCGLLGLSVCFSQLLGSLFAAREIKKKYPQLPILFGGSTCTPSVAASLIQTFTTIDYVLIGEGERPLAQLINHLDKQAPFPKENVLKRGEQGTTPPQLHNCEQKDLNLLPCPDYDAYFRELERQQLTFIPELPIEFSRGCWWNKCSFCNLNLQWCGYRHKKQQKMLAEVTLLSERHQCLDFFFTDNALPPGEARSFFQHTSNSPENFHFFAEIRAPKSSQECSTYHQGGLHAIQVGIEALSTSLLKRMCKGTTVMDNIAAMKFSAESGIALDGNLILDFPGSTAEEVRETCAILDFVLPYRPLQAASFFLGQGSPVCRDPGQFAIQALTQHPNNRLLFPAETLSHLDLLIKGYRGDRTVQKRQWQPVREKIADWVKFHQQRSNLNTPALSLRDGGSFLILRQERPGQSTLHHRLKGLSREIYLACAEPISKKKLLERFKTITKGQLEQFTRELSQKKLIYCDQSHCLALAVRTRNSNR